MIKLIALFLTSSASSTFNEYPKISLRYSDKNDASFDSSDCVFGYAITTFLERVNGLSVVFSVISFGNGITR